MQKDFYCVVFFLCLCFSLLICTFFIKVVMKNHEKIFFCLDIIACAIAKTYKKYLNFYKKYKYSGKLPFIICFILEIMIVPLMYYLLFDVDW